MSNENTVYFTTLAGANSEKTLAATAGNATGTIFTVPSGQRYTVLYGRSKIVCDGTAANRQIYLQIDDGSGNIRWSSRMGANITANQTKYVSWAAGVTDAGGSAAPDDVANLSLPSICILEAGEKLMQIVNAGVAGDSHTARIYIIACGVKT